MNPLHGHAHVRCGVGQCGPVFAKTWILYTGMPTSDVTLGSAKNANLWTGKLPIDEWDELVLVRNIGLNSVVVLNSTSIRLAASLEIPHHEGAGVILPEKDHHGKVSQGAREWRYEPFPKTG